MASEQNTAPASESDTPGIQASKRNFGAICVLLAYLCLAVVVAKTGLPPINRFGHDMMNQYEGAWRVIQGQRPHHDFHTSLGPGLFLILAAGVKLTGISAEGAVWSNILVLTVVMPVTWIIARRRMSTFLAVLYTVFCALVVCGPYVLGCSYFETTLGMPYNRYSYALLIILMASVFLPPPAGRRWEIIDGLAAGLIAATLFFIKVTFLPGAFFFIIAGLLVVPRNRRWFVALLIGGLIVTLPMLAYIRFDLPAMIGDLRMAALVRSSGAFSSSAADSKLPANYLTFIAVLAMALVQLGWRPARGNAMHHRLKLILIALVVVIDSVFHILTNFQWGDPVLCGAGAILLLEIARQSGFLQSWRTAMPGSLIRPLGLIAIAAAIVLPLGIKQIASLAYAAEWKYRYADSVPDEYRFQADSIRTMYVFWADGYGNERYPAKINEGLAMLRRHLRDSDRVGTLNFENPFNFALRRPSPRGDMLWWDRNLNFSEQHHPDPDLIFRDINVLMVPRDPDPEASTPLLAIYLDWIRAHFDLREQGQRWLLLVRRGT